VDDLNGFVERESGGIENFLRLGRAVTVIVGFTMQRAYDVAKM